MTRIGYGRYFAQGGDWGAGVTTAIAMQDKGHCAGIHVNMPSGSPTQEARDNPTERDNQAFEGGRYYQAWGAGYSKQQSTRPQTLGYGLVDSPMGQAAWIIEKFLEWTDCEDADGNKHPENVLTRDELLDNVMFYWLTASGASSARLYWESFNRTFGRGGGGQDHAAHRGEHLSQGDRTHTSKLGRATARQHRLLERTRQRRPFRPPSSSPICSSTNCASAFG